MDGTASPESSQRLRNRHELVEHAQCKDILTRSLLVSLSTVCQLWTLSREHTGSFSPQPSDRWRCPRAPLYQGDKPAWIRHEAKPADLGSLDITFLYLPQGLRYSSMRVLKEKTSSEEIMAEVLNTQFIAAEKGVTSEDTHSLLFFSFNASTHLLVWIYMLSVYSLVYKFVGVRFIL